MSLMNNYISEEGKENILLFKYKGGSVSIAYEYVWSPFCDWIVKRFVPSYIAPNTITLAAFVYVIIAHVCLMYHSHDFQQAQPAWVSLLMFSAILTYQILDNCDGKQARATGSSSPLGMLFDHGCDSIVTWLLGMCVVNIFLLTDMRLVYWSIMSLCLIPFYAAQWSQYHVGVFKLGRINAVDEGLILVWGVFLATWVFGQGIWRQEIFWGLDLGSIVTLSVSGMGVFQFMQFIVDTYQECKKQNKSFIDTLKDLQVVILLVMTHFVMYKYSDIHTNKQLLTLYFYGICLGWSKVTSHIQIAHITKEPFNQWRFTFVISCFAYIAICLLQLTQYLPYLVYTILFISFISYAHLVYSVTNTMADVLNICIFRLPKSEEKKKSS